MVCHAHLSGYDSARRPDGRTVGPLAFEYVCGIMDKHVWRPRPTRRYNGHVVCDNGLFCALGRAGPLAFEYACGIMDKHVWRSRPTRCYNGYVVCDNGSFCAVGRARPLACEECWSVYPSAAIVCAAVGVATRQSYRSSVGSPRCVGGTFVRTLLTRASARF